MTSWILHIFPEYTLASSLITTVWAGVLVICFFNLRFGWSLSGLIVPGYLVPLLMLKPWSAAADIIEAVAVYWIVLLFSEAGPRLNLWNSIFGRDRFFLILIVSVMVRILFDSFLFPSLTAWLGHHAGIHFIHQDGLYSIGLIIVALTANQFWNTGFRRAFPQFAVVLLITFIIVKYLLIGCTNFSLNDVAWLYEEIATSLAASPKAYIILIIAAFIASRMNLLYGWEYSGIIIPALLALQWYCPWKILVSLLEAGIIFVIAWALLRSPLFSNTTIEGARKILLFFNIGFLYKLAAGFILPVVSAGIYVPDYYAFGYMLSALIAINIHDKKLGFRIIWITIETSMTAVIMATIVGFALLYLKNPLLPGDAPQQEFTHEEMREPDTGLSLLLTKNQTSSYMTGTCLYYSKDIPAMISDGLKNLGSVESGANNKLLKTTALFVDRRIITPVMKIMENASDPASFTQEMKLVLLAAGTVSLDISACSTEKKGIPGYIRISRNSPVTKPFDGVFWFRTSDYRRIAIEITSPDPALVRLGAYLSEKLKARAILVSGQPLEYHADRKPGLTLFNLMNQVVMRELDAGAVPGAPTPLVICLASVTSANPGLYPEKTVYVSNSKGTGSIPEFSGSEKEVFALLEEYGLNVEAVDGRSITAGMEAYRLPQSKYLDETSSVKFMSIRMRKMNNELMKDDTSDTSDYLEQFE